MDCTTWKALVKILFQESSNTITITHGLTRLLMIFYSKMSHASILGADTDKYVYFSKRAATT